MRGKSEQEYKEIIRANLGNVLESGFIPELGKHKRGKVRDVHFKITEQSEANKISEEDKVIMVASDRVSCFDRVLSRCIPYKGAVLNYFNLWAMENAKDIVPNAMLECPDPNIIVQKQMKNIGIECVVRGYVWGSLANEYEKGLRKKCGIYLPEALKRYEKLSEPIFTPTTKAEREHDEDIDFEDIVNRFGKDVAEKIKSASIKLYLKGIELAEKSGMVFIDTKYEFGMDDKGELYLIDEANTPDSSRYCSKEEYEKKWKSGEKIREESKQYVRDVLIEAGYKEDMPLPELTDEQVIETAWRYIDSYERLTRKKFDFGKNELSIKQRIMNNLKKAGLAYGGCIIPIGASDKDMEHWRKLETALKDINVPYIEPLFKSAHKDLRGVLDYVEYMDKNSIEPLVYITFAGKSNALGPVVAACTKYPVITCPVFSDKTDYLINIHSSLQMPSSVSLMTVVNPGNAALAAKRIIDITRYD